MSKIFYNRITGGGGVFDDNANITDWPDFQESPIADSVEKIRTQRDTLLLQSDSMALADRITDDWRTYRQALRDLPASEGFPDVTFPVPPNGT